MSASRTPTLYHELGLRLAGAVLAALLALAVVLGVVYGVQHHRLDERWLADAQAHFVRQTQRVDAEWLRQADLLRAQIEFFGVLDDSDTRLVAARFTAFLASMGGQGTFTHVLVRDEAGRPLAHYATRSGTEPPAVPPGLPAPWIYSETDQLVYRVLRSPVRVGILGRGELILMVPVNNALLAAIAFPATHISLHWQGRGELAMSHPGDPSERAAPRGQRLVEGYFAWAGMAGAPELHISRLAQEVLPLAELMLLAAAGVLGAAVLAWMFIGRWARDQVRRIDTLSSAVDRFANGTEPAAALGAEVRAATDAADLELHRLGSGLASMMSTTEAADAAKTAARARLAELNATLEQRVEQRTRELAVARDEALAAARAKQFILAGVSHELRTPLVGLLGSLALADPQAMSSDQRRLLEVARRSGEALRDVIDDVLDYSRLEAMGAELRPLPMRVDELAAEVVALQAALALNKGLQVHCDSDAALARPVLADPVRLRQVLLNLLGNAVKFTEQGRIDLRLRALPAPDADHLALRLLVQDTGIGIGPEDQALLFSPFARAESARERSSSGTGLGLAIAQRLVAAMGSRIELDSAPGRGSTFWFDLVLPLASETCAAPPPAPAPTAALHGRVLLVEDNPVNRMIATEMLRRLGVEVDEAENGQHAIERLRGQGADLVLMDHQMPVLDGPGATARIRAGEAGASLAGVPIIAVTAHAQEGDAEQCIAAGMSDYLAKPFTQAELAAMLARWLQPANV